jgi:hypothetical protein
MRPSVGHRSVRAGSLPGMKLGENGATLPELLIALVVSAAALGLVGTAVYQLFIASSHGNARLTALHNLGNASLWLNRDTKQSATFSPGSAPIYGTFTTGDSSLQFRYAYDAANGALVRQRVVDGSVDQSMTVARGILDPSDILFSTSGSLVTVSLTVSDQQGQVTESMLLQSAMRVR